jgi:hypothetical protein
MDFGTAFGLFLALVALAVTVTPGIQNAWIATMAWLAAFGWAAWLVRSHRQDLIAVIVAFPWLSAASIWAVMGLVFLAIWAGVVMPWAARSLAAESKARASDGPVTPREASPPALISQIQLILDRPNPAFLLVLNTVIDENRNAGPLRDVRVFVVEVKNAQQAFNADGTVFLDPAGWGDFKEVELPGGPRFIPYGDETTFKLFDADDEWKSITLFGHKVEYEAVWQIKFRITWRGQAAPAYEYVQFVFTPGTAPPWW